MNFSDITSTKNGILQRCESLTNLGVGVGNNVDGGITGDATLKAIFTNYVNQAYYEVWMAQLSVDKHNPSDDYNYADLPDAPITMIVSQADYTIPVAVASANVATFIRLKGVYFLSNGVRTYLTQMTDEDTFTTTAGEPTKYRLNGKSIIFQCPLSAATLTKYSSLFHVEFQRTLDAFTTSDTTQQPGIMETYHDLIPLKASAIYLLPVDAALAQMYEQRFYARIELFKRDVALMDSNTPSRLTPAVEDNM